MSEVDLKDILIPGFTIRFCKHFSCTLLLLRPSHFSAPKAPWYFMIVCRCRTKTIWKVIKLFRGPQVTTSHNCSFPCKHKFCWQSVQYALCVLVLRLACNSYTYWTLSWGFGFLRPLCTCAGSSRLCSHMELAPLLAKVWTIWSGQSNELVMVHCRWVNNARM